MTGNEETVPSITAVIPAFDEATHIGDVVKGALKHTKKVLVVDDGSRDSTALVARAAGADVIRFAVNRGYGAALSTGISTAALNGSEVIVWLDADGQHDPAEIGRVCEPVLRGEADLVIGSRFLDKEGNREMPGYRNLGQKVLTRATNLPNGTKLTDSQSGFRCVSRKAAMSLNLTEEGMGFSSQMTMEASRLNMRIVEVPITCKYDGVDASSMKPVRHGMSVLTSILRVIRDEHPLLLFGVGGLTLTVAGVVIGLYSIYQYISHNTLPFIPSLVAVLLFFLGLTALFAGIILNALAVGRERRRHAD